MYYDNDDVGGAICLYFRLWVCNRPTVIGTVSVDGWGDWVVWCVVSDIYL